MRVASLEVEKRKMQIPTCPRSTLALRERVQAAELIEVAVQVAVMPSGFRSVPHRLIVSEFAAGLLALPIAIRKPLGGR
jgi:hypothetical protein